MLSLHIYHINITFIRRVTILKDKVTRRSRGVAFVQFLRPDEAVSCAKRLNNTEVDKF